MGPAVQHFVAHTDACQNPACQAGHPSLSPNSMNNSLQTGQVGISLVAGAGAAILHAFQGLPCRACECGYPVLLHRMPALCWCRPFVWDGQIYLGHWVAYLPAQERMAISVLHLEQGKTELVHRFSSLSKEIEDSVQPEVMAPQASYSLRRSLLPGRLTATVKTAEKSVFRCSATA